jgi:hypothetical protein
MIRVPFFLIHPPATIVSTAGIPPSRSWRTRKLIAWVVSMLTARFTISPKTNLFHRNLEPVRVTVLLDSDQPEGYSLFSLAFSQ